MRVKYYEEVQQLNEHPWFRVLLIVLALGTLLPLAYGIYWQVLNGVSWANEPMSYAGVITLFLFLICVCAAITWLLLSMELRYHIDREGIHYKFFPHAHRWVMISKEEIGGFKIEKKKFYHAPGHRRWEKVKTLNLNGTVLLSLMLKNGKTVKLGSRNREGLQWAMKKLLNSQEHN